MYVETFSRTFLVCLVTLVLTACGGGGGGGGGFDGGLGGSSSSSSSSSSGGSSGPATGEITLTVSGMVDADGNPDNILAGNEVATLTVEASEDGEDSELVIVFTTDLGILLQDSAQTINGVAEVQIRGDGTAGAATVTATATLSDGTKITASAVIQTSADSPLLQLYDADGVTIADNVQLLASETEDIIARILDWDGSPLSGVGITFVSTVLDINTTSGLTNASGEFTVTLTGTETEGAGKLSATASFGAFTLVDEIIANSLGVNRVANRIDIQAVDLGADAVLAGNEKVQLSAIVREDDAVKSGVSVTFTTSNGQLSPSSATSNASGVATVTLIGDGIAGTANITASATLTNGISVEDTLSVQTSADAPTLTLDVRNKASESVTEFGANQQLTLEATIVDYDGSPLPAEDQGVSVSFDAGGMGTLSKASDTTVFQDCPVNSLTKSNTDCAWVDFDSSATAGVGTVAATGTINGIVISDSVQVSNTGVNSGRADQDSFTITRAVGGTEFSTTDTVALEGDIYNNQQAQIRVDLADFFNNPVPDGTLVRFTSELGDIDGTCQTAGGTCEVTFTTTDPKTPNDSEVSFKDLNVDDCPSTIVFEETVTVSGTQALTDYRVGDILAVYNGATQLVEGAAFNQTANGISCITCTNGQNLRITYERAWLDEEADGTTTHLLLTPGVATEPFLDVRGVPCLASSRDRRERISGTVNPDGTVNVTGVGTQFLAELAVGDKLKLHQEVRTVTAVGSATSLVVDAPFSDGGIDTSPERLAAPAYLGGMGQPYGGRSTILAYARGEESFTDVNGNEEYDFGEPFRDLTEVVLDKNEDGVLGDVNGDSNAAGTVGPYRDAGLGTLAPGQAREKSNPYCYGPQTITGNPGDGDDSTEADAYCYQDGGEEDIFIDFDADGVIDVGNGIYDGSRCLTPLQAADGDGIADDTVCTTNTLNISRSVQVLLAGSFAETAFRAGSGAGTEGWGELITGIGNQGGNAVSVTVPAPENWDATNAAVTLDNAFGADVNSGGIGLGLGSLFTVPGVFPTLTATYNLSFDVAGNAGANEIQVLTGGTAIPLVATCNAAMTCTAVADFTPTSSDLTFANGTVAAADLQIDNIVITGTTTGINGTFRASPNNIVIPNNGGAAVEDFDVGTGPTQVMRGVSERAIGGTVPSLITTATSGTFWFTDKYNGQLPDGTTVTIEADNRTGCTLTSVGGVSVDFPDPGVDTGGPHSGSVTVGTDASTATSFGVWLTGTGSIIATVTTPIGNTTTTAISCSDSI